MASPYDFIPGMGSNNVLSAANQANLLSIRPSQQSPGGFPIYRQPQQTPITSRGYQPLPGSPGTFIRQPQPPGFPGVGGGSSNDFLMQPLPTSPSVGREDFGSFSPEIMTRIEALYNIQGGLTPEQQQILEIIKSTGAESTAANLARVQSGAMRRGITGSTIEQSGLAQTAGAGQAATQAQLAETGAQFAQDIQRRREALAGVLTDIGKIDIQNQRDAVMRLTDRLVQAGQFDINQVSQLRQLGAQLIQREIEDLRSKGLKETELAQEKILREKELENRLEQIRLKAEQDRQLALYEKQIDAPPNQPIQYIPGYGQSMTGPVQRNPYTGLPYVQAPIGAVPGFQRNYEFPSGSFAGK